MNLTLKRLETTPFGVFSRLSITDTDEQIAITLEHAFQANGSWYYTKVQPGTYVCQRGEHTLEHHPNSFETFEITGVEGHTNILFHIGNFNKDSEGCVLLGQARVDQMITLSEITFEKFMNLQKGIDQFTLVVE